MNGFHSLGHAVLNQLGRGCGRNDADGIVHRTGHIPHVSVDLQAQYLIALDIDGVDFALIPVVNQGIKEYLGMRIKGTWGSTNNRYRAGMEDIVQ